jgi:hypothetical protein
MFEVAVDYFIAGLYLANMNVVGHSLLPRQDTIREDFSGSAKAVLNQFPPSSRRHSTLEPRVKQWAIRRASNPSINISPGKSTQPNNNNTNGTNNVRHIVKRKCDKEEDERRNGEHTLEQRNGDDKVEPAAKSTNSKPVHPSVNYYVRRLNVKSAPSVKINGACENKTATSSKCRPTSERRLKQKSVTSQTLIARLLRLRQERQKNDDKGRSKGKNTHLFERRKSTNNTQDLRDFDKATENRWIDPSDGLNANDETTTLTQRSSRLTGRIRFADDCFAHGKQLNDLTAEESECQTKIVITDVDGFDELSSSDLDKNTIDSNRNDNTVICLPDSDVDESTDTSCDSDIIDSDFEETTGLDIDDNENSMMSQNYRSLSSADVGDVSDKGLSLYRPHRRSSIAGSSEVFRKLSRSTSQDLSAFRRYSITESIGDVFDNNCNNISNNNKNDRYFQQRAISMNLQGENSSAVSPRDVMASNLRRVPKGEQESKGSRSRRVLRKIMSYNTMDKLRRQQPDVSKPVCI